MMTHDKILSLTKAQYEPGPMRPRLVEVFAQAGAPLEAPKLAWIAYAGMGMSDMHDASAVDAAVAQTLIRDGRLVPTFEDNFFGSYDYLELTHFDDIQWARDSKGQLLIYRINSTGDDVLRLTERHAAAVKELENRTAYKKTYEDEPFMLNGTGSVTPILTDARQIALRVRRHGLALGMPRSSYL